VPPGVASRRRCREDVQAAAAGLQALERDLCHQPVAVGVEPEAGDLLNPPDPVGDSVGVHMEASCRPLRAVVLPEVAGEGSQQFGASLTVAPAELAKYLRRERPQLGQVRDL